MKILYFFRRKKPTPPSPAITPSTLLADDILMEAIQQHEKDKSDVSAIKIAFAAVQKGREAPESSGRNHFALQEMRDALMEEFTQQPPHFPDTISREKFVKAFAGMLRYSYGELTIKSGVAQKNTEIARAIAFKQIEIAFADFNNRPLFSGNQANYFPNTKGKIALAKEELTLVMHPPQVEPQSNKSYLEALATGKQMIETAAIRCGVHHEQCLTFTKAFSKIIADMFSNKPQTLAVLEANILENLISLFGNPQYIREGSDRQLGLTPAGKAHMGHFLENLSTASTSTAKTYGGHVR